MTIEREPRSEVDEGEPVSPEEISEAVRQLEKKHESLYEKAEPLQKEAVKQQELILGCATLELMERTGNNKEVLNAIANFLNTLENASMLGHGGEKLPKSVVEGLIEILEDASNKMHPSELGKGL